MKPFAFRSAWMLYVVVGSFSLTPFAGCGKKSSKSAVKSKQDVAISLVDADPSTGEDLTFTLDSRFGAVESAYWTLYSVSARGDLLPINNCESLKGKSITCNFSDAGKYRLHVAVKLADGSIVETSKDFEVGDGFILANQAPVIVLDLFKVGDSAKTATVSTFATEESGESVFAEGTSIVFDFRRTRDDGTPLSGIKFEMAVGDAAYQVVEAVSTPAALPMGAHIVHVRSTDADGNQSSKAFTLFVTCDTATTPEPVLSEAALNMSNVAARGKNWFQFSAAGAASGGTGQFKYMWDFNGDGVWDTAWNDDAAFPVPVYVNHVVKAPDGLFAALVPPQQARSYRFKVWDTQCNYVKVKEKAYDFTLPFANGTAGVEQGPQIPDYYFVQGLVRETPREGVTEKQKGLNVDFWGGYKFGVQTDRKQVLCQYNRYRSGEHGEVLEPFAKIQVQSVERYNAEQGLADYPSSFKKDGVFHGFELNIDDFPDDTFSKGGFRDGHSMLGAERDLSLNNAAKYDIRYMTDNAGDAAQAKTFTTSEGCQVAVKVKLIPTGVPCGPAVGRDGAQIPQKGETLGVSIDGTFACPTLKSDVNPDSDSTLAVDQGAFFCEVDPVDACYGGCCCCCCGIAPPPR